MYPQTIAAYCAANDIDRPRAIAHALAHGFSVGSYTTPIGPAIAAATDHDAAALDELDERLAADPSLVYVVA